MQSVGPLSALSEYKESILVCALQFDGRGDVYGAHEIALRVQKLMPQAKVVFTVLQPRFSAYEALLFAERDFVDLAKIQKEEGWEIEEESAALAKVDTFKRIIVFPTYHDTLLPPEILSRKTDVIKLREYSCGNANPQLVEGQAYTLGLNKAEGEKGVLLPIEFSDALPPNKEETPLQRLSHLEKVNPALSKEILGKDFSLEATQEFNKTSKLYLGYFSQPDVFFSYIRALLSCKEGNLVICNTQNRPAELLPNIHKALWKAGFGKVRVIEFTDPTHFKIESKQFKTDKPREKTCTIIFRPLYGVEMDAMLDASEDESLVTGDLSPFRFMAHRKITPYDTRCQKHESALAMIALAAKFNPRFKELLPQAFFGALEPGDVVDVIALENGMSALFRALDKDPQLKKDWNRFIDEVFTNHDFTPQLEQLLIESIK